MKLSSTSKSIYMYLCLFCFVSSGDAAVRGEGIITRRLRHNKGGPIQDNVDSPPVVPYTPAPSLSPSGEPTVVPSAAPTSMPSGEPTGVPSLLPTIAPSTSPTASPTTSPSSHPSSSPSGIPTLNPTDTPTSSAFPSAMPSSLPSASIAPSVSSQPSLVPSRVPTTSLTPTMDCSVDEDGFYGSSETGSSLIILFNYELELAAGASIADVLPDLEREFADSILPTFFAERCLENAGTSNESSSSVTGVSASPDDVVLDIVCSPRGENNTCQVLGGALSVFVTGNEENVAETVLEILKNGMANDEFLDADEAIERVTFVELEPSKPNSERVVDDPDLDVAGGGGSNFPVIFGILGGFAALLIILAAFVWRKKQKDSDQDGDTAADGPSDA